MDGRLIVFLGAGASVGSKNKSKNQLLLGNELAKYLAEKSGIEYKGDTLSAAYEASKHVSGGEVDAWLQELYQHCTPSSDLEILVQFPFFRIYTLNIDDAFENAAKNKNKQINVINKSDKIVEYDQMYERMDLIKLNGDINRVSEGLIFSATEYAQGSAKEHLWYNQVAVDYNRFVFLFIGTRLDESLFLHYVERYRELTKEGNIKSYLLVPELSEIQKLMFEGKNIEHIPATLNEFASWLTNEFPKIPTARDVFIRRNPQYHSMSEKLVDKQMALLPVIRESLSLLDEGPSNSNIKEFYKGRKPSWKDVLEEVPAELSKVSKFYEVLESARPGSLNLILGLAGSGKTTALMQLALKLSDRLGEKVFYIDEYINNFNKIIEDIDNTIPGKYYIFIERAADQARNIAELLVGNRSRAVIVTAENLRIWNSRVVSHLDNYVDARTDLSELDRSDVDKILGRIEKYGYWTRLSRMKLNKRRDELYKNSRKQLLIGLIETTFGDGYNKIIEKEYFSLEDDESKALLLLIGVATDNRTPASIETVSRAMYILGFSKNVLVILDRMSGVIYKKNNKLYVRHRVYVERLFENFIEPNELFRIVNAYLKAFASYDFPLARTMARNEFAIYKHLSNNKTLKRYFRGNENLVLEFYSNNEKDFEHEGLFLLQYALALRSFKRYSEAHEKAIVANIAFPNSPHIENSLAQLKMILADKCDHKAEAMNLFSEAEGILLPLTKNIYNSDSQSELDSYPAVTLIEGHMKILLKYSDDNEAIQKAREYFNMLGRNKKLESDSRVSELRRSLIEFTVTRSWIEKSIE